MVACNDMKKGEVYACETCGLELEVLKECDCPDDHCEPKTASGECCEFDCCGKPMVRK
ncbi:MAG: hypothetical protein GX127_01565 [Eubacteriaceae bacterium]|jgi:hypothetical protein|nr:hypothetical protein [Eubacteriaceae bacterium]